MTSPSDASPPAPTIGQVIRYRYLWRREATAGREEASKDRPCAIVLAIPARRDRDTGPNVVVAPITHTPPSDSEPAIEIPVAVKRSLGLDDGPSWIILSEVNRFVWPGPDLVPLRARKRANEMIYGTLPPGLTARTLAILAREIRAKRLRVVSRTE